MKRRSSLLLAFVLLMLPVPVYADGDAGLVATTTTSTSTGGLGHVLELAGRAFYDHAWTLFAGLALTAGIIVLRTFAKIPDAWVPWFTIAIAVGTSVAVGLQSHQPIGTTLSTGALVGVAAIGGWESLGKLVRGGLFRFLGPPPPPDAATTIPDIQKPAGG